MTKLTLIALLSIGLGFAAQKTDAREFAAGPDHLQWDKLLKQYVNDAGMVDYTSWSQSTALLDQYLEHLSLHSPVPDWAKNEKLAYWINAYNAFTVKLILDNYPIASIRDTDTPWELEFIVIGAKKMSLSHIEHQILRKEFKDARVHFAINCASISCPPLLNEAYLPATLDKQLDRQARGFINSKNYNQLSSESANLSQIFEWYMDDFGGKEALIPYINRYSATAVDKDAPIGFLKYNWALNEQK